jgi:hypothetical protein
LNGAAQIGHAILRPMAPPSADIAETPEQLGWIDRTAVDVSGKRRKVSTRNSRNLIGDRCLRKIGVFVDR